MQRAFVVLLMGIVAPVFLSGPVGAQENEKDLKRKRDRAQVIKMLDRDIKKSIHKKAQRFADRFVRHCGKTYITFRGYSELPREIMEKTGKLIGKDPITVTVRKTDIIEVANLTNKTNEGYVVQTPTKTGQKGTHNYWVYWEMYRWVIKCLD